MRAAAHFLAVSDTSFGTFDHRLRDSVANYILALRYA